MIREYAVTAIPGLDDDAYDRIAALWSPLYDFLATNVVPRAPDTTLLLPRDYAQLRTPFAALKDEITAKGSIDWVVRQRGLAT